MIMTEISEYKRTLRLYINGLGLCSSAGFSVMQFMDSHYTRASLSAVSAIYFLAVIFYLYKHRHYLWHGRGFVLVGPLVLLHAIYVNPPYGVYWIYVGIVGTFLMLRLKDACISATIFLVLSLYYVTSHFSEDVLYRIYATVITVSLFSFFFSYLIERLLNSLNVVATRDPLTKALNRHTFHKSIDNALIENRRHQVTAVLFFFDLDHFKKVNDTHGHLVGDKILQDISKIVQDRVRETDQFFRYGGEEFALLLRHTSLQNAAHVAEDIRSLIEGHTFTSGLKITISGGLSEVHQSIDVHTWIERSDNALYEAKSAGRNCIRIHVPELESWPAGQTATAQPAQ